MRCQQTVQPLARDRYLRVEPSPTLGVDGSPAEVLALFWNRSLYRTVLCGHGEMIAWLLTHLATDGLVTNAPLRAAKGSTWLLERTSRQVYAHYLPPLALAWQEAEMSGGH